MRIYICTDLDEFAPHFATIDIIWDQPPKSVLESLPPPTTLMYGLLLQPEILVDMQDPYDPGGVRPPLYDDAA